MRSGRVSAVEPTYRTGARGAVGRLGTARPTIRKNVLRSGIGPEPLHSRHIHALQRHRAHRIPRRLFINQSHTLRVPHRHMRWVVASRHAYIAYVRLPRTSISSTAHAIHRHNISRSPLSTHGNLTRAPSAAGIVELALTWMDEMHGMVACRRIRRRRHLHPVSWTWPVPHLTHGRGSTWRGYR